MWEILLPAPQFCPEPKSALKNKVYLKVHNDDDDDTGCILIKIPTKLYYMENFWGESLINFLIPKGLDICKLLFESSGTQSKFVSILEKMSTAYMVSYSECYQNLGI